MGTRVKEYSGAKFGRPDSTFMSRSWRIQHGLMVPRAVSLAAGAALPGQDAVTVGNLTNGLPVYGGYNRGTYANMPELQAAHPDAKLIAITPWSAPAPCLDVEPGDAKPSDCPGFFQIAGDVAPLVKPMFYMSAGDSQTVINALANAGITRSRYLLWSAHWIGPHICGRGSCGYPDADACQYASNQRFDSDLFGAACFAAPAPPPPPPPPPPPVVHYLNGDAVILEPGKDKPPVSVAFNAPGEFKSVALLADAGLSGDTSIRVAAHHSGKVAWTVSTVKLTVAAPHVNTALPADCDGVSFTRIDNMSVSVVPNFGA